jgi:hypothetical protein
MALGSTQPPTEMSTRYFPGGRGRPARETDNLTAISDLTLWASTACYRDSFTFILFLMTVSVFYSVEL